MGMGRPSGLDLTRDLKVPINIGIGDTLDIHEKRILSLLKESPTFVNHPKSERERVFLP